MHVSAARSRTAAWIAVPLAVVASGSLIATASYAAFSASTSNADNSWSTGKLSLTDDDQDTALFTVDSMVPGSTGSNCLTLSTTSTNPSTVKLFTTNTSTDATLAADIDMVIEAGTLGTAGDCNSFANGQKVYDGTLGGLVSKTNFASGVAMWKPTIGDDEQTYRITYTLGADTTNSAQDSAVATTFVWEAQTD